MTARYSPIYPYPIQKSAAHQRIKKLSTVAKGSLFLKKLSHFDENLYHRGALLTPNQRNQQCFSPKRSYLQFSNFRINSVKAENAMVFDLKKGLSDLKTTGNLQRDYFLLDPIFEGMQNLQFSKKRRGSAWIDVASSIIGHFAPKQLIPKDMRRLESQAMQHLQEW